MSNKDKVELRFLRLLVGLSMGQKSLHVDVYHWRALMKGLYMFPLGMYRDFTSLQVRTVHSLHNVELVCMVLLAQNNSLRKAAVLQLLPLYRKLMKIRSVKLLFFFPEFFYMKMTDNTGSRPITVSTHVVDVPRLFPSNV